MSRATLKTWIVRGAVGVSGLLALAAAALAVAAHLGDRKMTRRVALQVEPVPWRTDDDAITRGRYLFESRGCTDCHGADGAGRDVLRDDHGLHVRAPNLTRGAHGVVGRYTAADWDLAIRHGVARDGRPLLVMPSEDYARLTNADFSSLVAYLRQLPSVDGQPGVMALPLPMRAMYGAGLIRDAAEKIDHARPADVPVPEGVTPAHGAYVANACIGCHGERLSGGPIPGTPPDWPPASNLTPGDGSAMARYATADQFAHMLRTGQRPDGSRVSPVMPFGSLRHLNDTDVRALYLHLQTLPAVAAGSH